jgi:hypothetical protein
MSLPLDLIRLHIADDVGVGKTIEAGLIARELWERGEVRPLAVLFPPYLKRPVAERAYGEAPPGRSGDQLGYTGKRSLLECENLYVLKLDLVFDEWTYET